MKSTPCGPRLRSPCPVTRPTASTHSLAKAELGSTTVLAAQPRPLSRLTQTFNHLVLESSREQAMKVPRAVIMSTDFGSSPRLPPLRRILRETGLEVVRPARRLPRAWQRFVRSKRFARSRPWSRLRYDFLRDQDGRCRCCGQGASDGARLNVDHILSRKTHPQLALAYANLQLLCSTCNQGKGNRDGTDWRFRRSSRRPGKGCRGATGAVRSSPRQKLTRNPSRTHARRRKVSAHRYFRRHYPY